MTKKSLYLLFLVGVNFVLVGCKTTGQHINFYQGQPRSTNEVALVKFQHDSPFALAGATAVVWNVDGTNLHKIFVSNNTHEIAFLPGTHTILLKYLGKNSVPFSASCQISFRCESNHIYHVYLEPIPIGMATSLKKAIFGGKFQVTAWVVDEQTKEVIVGRRRDEPMHWYDP